MTSKISPVSTVVITISALKEKRDLLDNRVIESVARVFFPALGNLKVLAQTIKTKDPAAQVKIWRQSQTSDPLATARAALFGLGAEMTKIIAAQQMGLYDISLQEEKSDSFTPQVPPPSPSKSESPLPTLAPFSSLSEEECAEEDFYPVIYGISEPSRTFKWESKIFCFEANIQIVLPTKENFVNTEKILRQSDPNITMQTHFHCHRENFENVAEFITQADKAQEEKETPRAIKQNLTSSAPNVLDLTGRLNQDYFS